MTRLNTPAAGLQQILKDCQPDMFQTAGSLDNGNRFGIYD
jgi:hypothetical protein